MPQPHAHRPVRRLATLLAALALSAGLLAAPSAVGGAKAAPTKAPRAHAAASYFTGVGDESVVMFANPLWAQLRTKIVRYIAPYDAVRHSYSLDRARLFIREAEAHHQQVLIAFYHSEYSPLTLPSVASYQRDVQRFIKLFPRVHQYQAWDEANRGYIPHALASPSAAATARYYQALIRVCHGCTAIGLDVLDAQKIGPTLQYIAEFKHEIGRLRTIMPRIWGLHNYSDINRLESWRTHELVRALGGQVWLTETGGIVQFGGAFPNRRGSGLTRAAKVLKYMFAVASSQPQVKRLYIYDWTGGTPSTRFDAGLMSAHDQPRAGYIVVCKQLHARRCGGVKLARN
jgi:hypothetical protein